MSNIWHDINPRRISPDDFVVVVEISKGSKNKYELDKETGMLRLDRILYTSTHYPASYGFIPRTYADDGDPLDALVLCSEPIIPMTLVRCYPIGAIKMIDNGANDEKVIAIPFDDPTYNGYHDISELPKHIFEEMAHFFTVYKALENKTTAVDEIIGNEQVRDIIKGAIEHYKEEFCRDPRDGRDPRLGNPFPVLFGRVGRTGITDPCRGTGTHRFPRVKDSPPVRSVRMRDR